MDSRLSAHLGSKRVYHAANAYRFEDLSRLLSAPALTFEADEPISFAERLSAPGAAQANLSPELASAVRSTASSIPASPLIDPQSAHPVAAYQSTPISNAAAAAGHSAHMDSNASQRSASATMRSRPRLSQEWSSIPPPHVDEHEFKREVFQARAERRSLNRLSDAEAAAPSTQRAESTDAPEASSAYLKELASSNLASRQQLEQEMRRLKEIITREQAEQDARVRKAIEDDRRVREAEEAERRRKAAEEEAKRQAEIARQVAEAKAKAEAARKALEEKQKADQAAAERKAQEMKARTDADRVKADHKQALTHAAALQTAGDVDASTAAIQAAEQNILRRIDISQKADQIAVRRCSAAILFRIVHNSLRFESSLDPEPTSIQSCEIAAGGQHRCRGNTTDQHGFRYPRISLEADRCNECSAELRTGGTCRSLCLPPDLRQGD